MRYGPMDWTNVISATATFYLWGESIITDPQAPYEGDTLYVGSSTYCDELACIMAGEYYYGDYLNGSETNGYTRIEQGLTDGFGDDQVYLVFNFVSDSYDYARGFIIDDISMQAIYGKHIYVPLIQNNSN